MPIVPDTKDWTWVLERPCPECGLDVSGIEREAVSSMLRQQAVAWRAALAAVGGAAPRPDRERWSALEYACHVRDVFRLYDQRLALMLGEDDPLFANWDQDETAVAERYHEQDPAVVVDELAAAAEHLAARFDTVDGEQWSRPGRRSDGAAFTVESFARYMIHDPVHHLHDVTR